MQEQDCRINTIIHYDIELLASAWEELDRIDDIHLNLADVKSAWEITDRILDTIQLLTDNPYPGVEPKYTQTADRSFRILICEKYLCFSKIGSDTIKIYHIANGKTDYPNLF